MSPLSRLLLPLSREGSLSCHTIINRRDLGLHGLTQRSAYYDKSRVLMTYTHPNPARISLRKRIQHPRPWDPPPLPHHPLDWPMHLQSQKRGGGSYVKHRTERRQDGRGHFDMISCTVFSVGK